jgi:Trypsin-like peptidase domain
VVPTGQATRDAKCAGNGALSVIMSPMRTVAAVLGVALLLTACGQPAGPVGAPSLRIQVVDASEIPVAVPVNPDPRVGPIFHGNTDIHTCTASVVHSSGGNLILTAAHCMASHLTTTFVPGFAKTASPSNIWTVDAVYFDPLWVTSKDPRVDYAFLRVSRAGGGSIEAQVGSALVLGTAPPAGTQIGIIGYPFGIGGMPIGCQNTTTITLGIYPTFACKGLVVGTSGSPWISGMTVTGVTGGYERGGYTPKVSYSSPFNARTAALLARAEAGGPGDAT